MFYIINVYIVLYNYIYYYIYSIYVLYAIYNILYIIYIIYRERGQGGIDFKELAYAVI